MKTIAKLSGFLCTAIAVSSVASTASAANLVQNGGFENPNVPSNDWRYYGGTKTSHSKYGGPTVPGWNHLNNKSTIEIRNQHVGMAYEGNQFAEIDSHKYGDAPQVGFFQDIATQIGKKYKLSFFYGPRQGYKAEDNLLNVSFGSINQDLNAGKRRSAPAWQNFTDTIIADSTSTKLTFKLLGTRNTLGANVDAVSVTAVPEPFSLMGLAAVGAVGAASVICKRTTA
jgi:opacity protein-like surface antigen